MCFGHPLWIGRRLAMLALGAGILCGVPANPVRAATSPAAAMALLSETIRFASPPLYPVAYEWRSCATADFDHSSRPDLAVSFDSEIRILLNDGEGVLAAPLAVPMSLPLVAFAVADLDADGDPDLVGAGALGSGHGLAVRRGLPGTGFTPVETVPLGGRPSDLGVGDLDGDGDPDVVVVSNQVDSLWVFDGDGSGSLEPTPRAVALPRISVRVIVTDLQPDGALDVVVVHHGVEAGSNRVSVLVGRGGGVLEAADELNLPQALFDVTAADLDEDGAPDLAFIASDSVVVAHGRGDGSFDAPRGVSRVASASPYYDPWMGIAAGDLDRDGYMDLACCYRTLGYWQERNYVDVLIGRGDGTFEVPQKYVVPKNPEALRLDDLDGDGWLDVVALAEGRDVVLDNRPAGATVLMNHGDGTLAGPMEIPFDPGRTAQAHFPGAIEAVRLRAQATPDLVVTDDLRSFVMLNQRGNVFSAPIDIGPGTVVAAADLDADGLEDVVLRSSDSTWVWRSLGDGHLALADLFTGGEWIGLADLDGDGLRDLAFRLPDLRLAVRRGAPGALFGALEILDLTFRDDVAAIAFADVNADGRADLLTGLATYEDAGASDSLAIQLGLPGLQFSEPEFHALPRPDPRCCSRPREIAVGTIDGDDRPDVVVLNASTIGSDVSGNLNLFTQDASGAFQWQGSFDAGNSPNDLTLADLNRDGLQEVVTVNANGGETFHFYFHENDGGVLLPWERSRVADFSTNVAVADLNGDVWPDLVTYTPRWGLLTVTRNESQPVIPTAVAFSLIAAEARAGVVRLAWWTSLEDHEIVHVQRRETGSGWRGIASFPTSGATIRFEDRAVVPGMRYGYRAGLRRGRNEQYGPEVWVDVPPAAGFSLRGTVANPTHGEPVAWFSLPAAGSVDLELIDVAGRRLRVLRLEGLEAGDHRVALSGGAEPLSPGLYLLRAVHEGRVETRRVSVVH